MFPGGRGGSGAERSFLNMRDATSDGYFLYHSIGLRPGGGEAMAEALGAFARMWSAPGPQAWGETLPLLQRFRSVWARLIGGGAEPSQIALTPSVTAAMMGLIDAMDAERLAGRKVLIGEDAFPSMHFLLQGLAQRIGFEIRRVPRSPGKAYVESGDFAAALDGDVALVLATWVTSTASAVTDLDRVCAAAGTDSLVVVDITQGVGILPLAVPERVDAVIGSSLKWLCGAAGAGALFVRPRVLAGLHPAYRGWFSQENPMAWDLDGFEYASDARRFENGTPSPLPYVASLPGLEWVLETGVETLLAHNRSLTEPLVEGLSAAGLRIASPADPRRRGGSVMVDLETPARAEAALASLATAGIHADARAGTLRLSPGILTSRAAVERCVDRLAETTSSTLKTTEI